MKKIILSSLLMLGTCVTGYSNQEVTSRINKLAQEQNLIGLAVAQVKGGTIEYSHGFGLANIAQNTPVTPDTIFLIASASKPITAVALMTLFDQGKFKLDDPINKYLPFAVINPKHPNTPITFRMLLTHTSSISDELYDAMPERYVYGSDQKPNPQTAFNQLITDYFAPTGKFYKKEGIFSDTKPGTKENYSNMGSALIGYLVQQISGMPFNEYTKKAIFSKLGMNNTGWFLSEIDLNKLAMPYAGGNKKPYGHYTFPDYPNGQLMTSVNDLAKFLMMVIQKGSLGGVEVLKPSTVDLMLQKNPPAAPNYGLHWYYQQFNGMSLVGHEGSEMGAATAFFFNPATGVGALVFTNTDDENFKGRQSRESSLDPFITELVRFGQQPKTSAPTTKQPSTVNNDQDYE